METTAFKAYIADNMKRNYIEAKVLRKILKALKDAGTPVTRVWDGGEMVNVKTNQDVFEQVFNLDECHLYTAEGSWVFFVNGNEWDAICDYTVDLEDALASVNDWVNEHD